MDTDGARTHRNAPNPFVVVLAATLAGLISGRITRRFTAKDPRK